MGGGLGALCAFVQEGFCVGPLGEWGLLDVPWSSEAPVKGGEWRVVSMGVVSNSDGTGGAPSKGWARV